MVKIIADTLSSITVNEAKELGIDLIPQIIIFGDESFKDDKEIDSTTFIEKLKKSTTLPRTAAPYPSLYYPILDRLTAGDDEILIICPSSKMSGTYSRAVVASQEYPRASITIVETPLLGAGLGTLVRQAVEWAFQGSDANTIAEKIKLMAVKNRTYFLVETLEYLQRGGRIGAAKAIVGSLLQVKPLLGLINGEVDAIESQRTYKKAMQCFLERIEKECPRSAQAHLNVQHGGVIDQASKLASELEKRLGIRPIPISDLPSAILVHAGPGVLGVSYFVS